MTAKITRRGLIVIAVLAALQIAVLLVMPVFSGPQIPRDTTVQLSGERVPPTKSDGDADAALGTIDFGFRTLTVPAGIKPNQELYVELRGDASSDTPMTLGRVVSDPADLPDGAVWIKLMRDGDHRRVDAAELTELTDYYEPDSSMQKQLSSADSVTVSIALSRDGTPMINDVRPVKSSA